MSVASTAAESLPSFALPPRLLDDDPDNMELWLLRAPSHVDVSELLNGATIRITIDADDDHNNNSSFAMNSTAAAAAAATGSNNGNNRVMSIFEANGREYAITQQRRNYVTSGNINAATANDNNAFDGSAVRLLVPSSNNNSNDDDDDDDYLIPYNLPFHRHVTLTSSLSTTTTTS